MSYNAIRIANRMSETSRREENLDTTMLLDDGVSDGEIDADDVAEELESGGVRDGSCMDAVFEESVLRRISYLQRKDRS